MTRGTVRERKLMPRRISLEVGVLVGLAALGGLMLVAAPDTEGVAVTDLLGPAWFPRVLGTLLIVGAAVQLVRLLLGPTFGRTAPPEPGDDDDRDVIVDSGGRALARIGVVIAYLVTLPLLGFLLSTALASLGLVAAWTRRISVGALVFALVLSASTFYVFSSLLNVRLP